MNDLVIVANVWKFTSVRYSNEVSVAFLWSFLQSCKRNSSKQSKSECYLQTNLIHGVILFAHDRSKLALASTHKPWIIHPHNCIDIADSNCSQLQLDIMIISADDSSGHYVK